MDDNGNAHLVQTEAAVQAFFDNPRRIINLSDLAQQDLCIDPLTVERDGYKRLAERRSADIVRLIEEIKRLTFERDAALRLLAGKDPEPEVNPVFSAIAVHQAQGVR